MNEDNDYQSVKSKPNSKIESVAHHKSAVEFSCQQSKIKRGIPDGLFVIPNKQQLIDEEAGDDEDEEVIQDKGCFKTCLKSLWINLFPDNSPFWWFGIHICITIVIFIITIARVISGVHRNIPHTGGNLDPGMVGYVLSGALAMFVNLVVNFGFFAAFMLFRFIVILGVLGVMCYEMRFTSAVTATVDPEVFYVAWTVFQYIFWEGQIRTCENTPVFVLVYIAILGSNYKFFEFNKSWIQITNMIYLLCAVRRLVLSISLFLFELGFLMNMNSQLVKYLQTYALLKKLNPSSVSLPSAEKDNAKTFRNVLNSMYVTQRNTPCLENVHRNNKNKSGHTNLPNNVLKSVNEEKKQFCNLNYANMNSSVFANNENNIGKINLENDVEQCVEKVRRRRKKESHGTNYKRKTRVLSYLGILDFFREKKQKGNKKSNMQDFSASECEKFCSTSHDILRFVGEDNKGNPCDDPADILNNAQITYSKQGALLKLREACYFPVFLTKQNIEKTQNSQIHNWLMVHHVLNYVPALFVCGKRVELTNKLTAKSTGEFLFDELLRKYDEIKQLDDADYANGGLSPRLSQSNRRSFSFDPYLMPSAKVLDSTAALSATTNPNNCNNEKCFANSPLVQKDHFNLPSVEEDKESKSDSRNVAPTSSFHAFPLHSLYSSSDSRGILEHQKLGRPPPFENSGTNCILSDSRNSNTANAKQFHAEPFEKPLHHQDVQENLKLFRSESCQRIEIDSNKNNLCSEFKRKDSLPLNLFETAIRRSKERKFQRDAAHFSKPYNSFVGDYNTNNLSNGRDLPTQDSQTEETQHRHLGTKYYDCRGYVTRSLVDIFMKPEEAEHFMKIVDLAGHGKIDEAMFVRAVVLVYALRKKFIKSVKSRESVANVVSRMISLLLWFIVFVSALLLLGVPLNTIVISGAAILSAMTVALSYIYTNFINSVMFVAFQNPYNVGDRVKIDDGPPMYVKKIRTYTTEFESLHGKPIIWPNYQLSTRSVCNESRCKNASYEIIVQIDINTPPSSVKALKAAVEKFALDRPYDFVKDSFACLAYDFKPGFFYELAFWLTVVEGWANWRKVYVLRTELFEYIILVLRKFSISFRLPEQKINFVNNLNYRSLNSSKFFENRSDSERNLKSLEFKNDPRHYHSFEMEDFGSKRFDGEEGATELRNSFFGNAERRSRYDCGDGTEQRYLAICDNSRIFYENERNLSDLQNNDHLWNRISGIKNFNDERDFSGNAGLNNLYKTAHNDGVSEMETKTTVNKNFRMQCYSAKQVFNSNKLARSVNYFASLNDEPKRKRVPQDVNEREFKDAQKNYKLINNENTNNYYNNVRHRDKARFFES